MFRTPNPVMSRSSNPSSELKEPIKFSGPMSEKKEPAKASSHIVSEKKEPIRSPRSLPEKTEPSSFRSSSSLFSDKKEPVSVRSSASPFSEKKERSSARTSLSPLSEKKEDVSMRALSSPLSEKKEDVSMRALSSPLSEKKEPFLRSSSSHLSQKKDPARSSTSSLSEKTELNIKSPSSPDLSEKRDADLVEPDWQHASPVATPASPSASSTAYSPREISKPPPIEVPTYPHVEERPIQVDSRIVEDPKSPAREKLVSLTPAVSETSFHVPPSPLASEVSLPVPETPPGLDSAGNDSSMTMEHLVLPDSVHSVNGEVAHAAFNNEDTPRSGFSALNGDQQHREDSPSVKGSASASASDNVVNGHTSNGHHGNGDRSKLRKGEKVDNGENGESPTIPSKRPTSRYMEPTESAMAKFRSSSNPKTRAPDTPESPARTPKRYSIGGTPLMTSKGTDSPKTAFGTRKSNSFQNRGTPSPKAVAPKEKLIRSV